MIPPKAPEIEAAEKNAAILFVGEVFVRMNGPNNERTVFEV
jgi:hypothetical protein